METLMQDLRYGWRVLANSPGVTTIALLTLALGIGANTAIFSLVNGVLLEPLPYPDADRLVMVWEHNRPRERGQNVVNPANFLAWRERNRVFESMAGVFDYSINLTGVQDPEELDAEIVNREIFAMLGAEAALGRTFTAGEDSEGADTVVLLSHRFWQRRLGGDPEIVGKTLELNGDAVPVIGVMPEGFQIVAEEADVWIPMRFREAHRQSSGRYMAAMGLIATGVTLEQAREDMNRIGTELEAEFPDRNAGWGVNLVPLHEQVTGEVRPALLLLLAAVGMLLLIACTNVANLLLAKASGRRREMAVRSSLGARRSRIVRQLLCEALLLAAGGALLGIGLAAAATRGLVRLLPESVDLPRLEQVGLDFTVLLFALGAGCLTALLFGLAPAIAGSRADLTEALKDGRATAGGAHGKRLRGGLVVAEIALAAMLLIGSGLLLRSFSALTRVDPGFDPDGILTLQLQFPGGRFDSEQELFAHQQGLLERIAQLPGVVSVGSIQFLPIGGLRSATSFYPGDRPEPEPGQHPTTDVRTVAGDYFRTMGLPLLSGRVFASADNTDTPAVVIINRRLAAEVWPGDNPIGKELVLGWGDWIPLQVVGVVGNAHHEGLDIAEKPAIYRPLAQDSWGLMSMLVRTAGEPTSLTRAIVGVIHQQDPDQPVSEIQTMNEVIGASLGRSRMNMLLLSLFSLLALVLAAIGIYGVMSYSVSERLHEIGVRMALGADRLAVYRLVLRQSLMLTLGGLALGLVTAFWATRLMSSLLFGVAATDPITFVSGATALLLVALIASLIPAHRGTRVDPAVALRNE